MWNLIHAKWQIPPHFPQQFSWYECVFHIIPERNVEKQIFFHKYSRCSRLDLSTIEKKAFLQWLFTRLGWGIWQHHDIATCYLGDIVRLLKAIICITKSSWQGSSSVPVLAALPEDCSQRRRQGWNQQELLCSQSQSVQSCTWPFKGILISFIHTSA